MGQLWAHKMTIGGVYLCPMDIIWPFILYLLYLYFSELCFLCYYFSLFLFIGSITDLLMRCDPSNGYILLYTCGPGTNSFSHASVYLVKEKVLSLVLINEHVHVWKVDEDTQVQLQASDLDWTATCNKTPHITKQGAAVYDYVVTQLICLQMVWQQWCVPYRTSVFLLQLNFAMSCSNIL